MKKEAEFTRQGFILLLLAEMIFKELKRLVQSNTFQNKEIDCQEQL
jgi:hypothetical protein